MDKQVKKVVGIYESEQEAIEAIEGLLSQGYDKQDICVVGKDLKNVNHVSEETGVVAEETCYRCANRRNHWRRNRFISRGRGSGHPRSWTNHRCRSNCYKFNRSDSGRWFRWISWSIDWNWNSRG